MALDSLVKFNTRGALAAIDGSVSPITVACAYDLGDFAAGPLPDVLNETVDLERRGIHLDEGYGKRVYPEGTFTCYLNQLGDTDAGSFGDFLMGKGVYASGGATPSTGVGSTRVRHLNLQWTMEGSSYGGTDLVILFKRCRVIIDNIGEAADGNKLSISWKCKGEVWVNGVLYCREIQ